MYNPNHISYNDRISQLETQLEATEKALLDTTNQLHLVTAAMFEQLALMHQRVKLLEKTAKKSVKLPKVK